MRFAALRADRMWSNVAVSLPRGAICKCATDCELMNLLWDASNMLLRLVSAGNDSDEAAAASIAATTSGEG
jgi:hypothetical protein